MEPLQIGTQKYTSVHVLDEPGAGNACHVYAIDPKPMVSTQDRGDLWPTIRFQNGPIKEVGVNGVHNEDLIAIVVHRLQGFQSGPYACRENALALTKLEEALHWLNHRTSAREKRGVEGTHTI